MSTAPPPPRLLTKSAKMGLWVGPPLYVLSTLALLLVTLGLLMLFLTYGMGFSYLVALSGESVRVDSAVGEVSTERLASGGLAYMATAQVKVNEQVVTAYGFGPSAEKAKVGDSVTIVVPKSSPQLAHLEGFWPKPVSPGLLLQFAAWFYLPGLVGLLLSCIWSWRAHGLIQLGKLAKGKRTRAIGLPRPLKDKVIARWQYEDEDGDQRTFWTLQAADLEEPTLLVHGKRAGLLESLLPQWSARGKELDCKSFWRKLFMWCSMTLMMVQLLLVVLFFLT